ncbi:MAG: ABC transporter substrate-binding protein [Devosiaceae bacterium]|nr:ABC transporter substrate-binding protein [Devosiaceae bacterium]
MPVLKKLHILFAAAMLSVTPIIADEPDPKNWDQLLEEAKGQEVFWHAWGGSENINAYIAWVGDEVNSRYGVTLTQVKISETANVVARVLAEQSAGRNEGGAVDLVWVNGENFAAMKRQGLLLSNPWSTNLPNYQLTDFENKAVLSMDFTESVDGLESPWGTAQLTFYYDSANPSFESNSPPTSLDELADWIEKNPGRFTYAAPPNFIGTTFLKQVLYGLVDDISVLRQPADQETFDEVTAPLWAWLDKVQPNLWRSGRVYAADTTNLKTLLSDNEIDIAMTFNPGEASSAVIEGLLPQTTRSFVMDYGSIGNAHFVAIPFNANAKAGAMVVANFLMSPEAQARKSDEAIWGDPTVLAIDKLNVEQLSFFDSLAPGEATLSADEFGAILSEPDASWSDALDAEWARRYGAGN